MGENKHNQIEQNPSEKITEADATLFKTLPDDRPTVVPVNDTSTLPSLRRLARAGYLREMVYTNDPASSTAGFIKPKRVPVDSPNGLYKQSRLTEYHRAAYDRFQEHADSLVRKPLQPKIPKDTGTTNELMNQGTAEQASSGPTAVADQANVEFQNYLISLYDYLKQTNPPSCFFTDLKFPTSVAPENYLTFLGKMELLGLVKIQAKDGKLHVEIL